MARRRPTPDQPATASDAPEAVVRDLAAHADGHAAACAPPTPQQLVRQVADGMALGDAAEPARPDTDFPPPGEAREARPRSYTGQRVSLPDGTVAHYRDHGNRDGVVVRFDLPEGVDKPAAGVTEPLKEHREGRGNFVYKGKGDWHKQVGGYKKNPVAERLDAEQRFAEAVKRQREAGEQDGPAR